MFYNIHSDVTSKLCIVLFSIDMSIRTKLFVLFWTLKQDMACFLSKPDNLIQKTQNWIQLLDFIIT